MPEEVFLGKCPTSADERRKLIGEHLAEEDQKTFAASGIIQRIVIDRLTGSKGFSPDDIETDKPFTVSLPGLGFTACADIIVHCNNLPSLYIKCALHTPDSWERYAIAFCRAAGERFIPFAVVTDGESAKTLDAGTGSVVSEGLDGIPDRETLCGMMRQKSDFCITDLSREREKRILHAFEGIRCLPVGEQEP